MNQHLHLQIPEDDAIVCFITRQRDADVCNIFSTKDWWYLSPRDLVPLKSQGWKLHISTIPENAIALLEVVAPLLIEQRIQWKVVLTIDHLIRFSSPPSALAQLGKFITIYPRNDDIAVNIAALLHTKTHQFLGPVIPSDFRYIGGSQVYYRYGGFTQQFFYNPRTSLRTPCIVTLSGQKIPDERTTSPHYPEGVNNPFPKPNNKLAAVQNGLFGRGLKVLGVLSQTIKGGVYVVSDGSATRILKEARLGTCPDVFGRDARDRLTNEYNLLKKIAHLGIAPQPVDIFDADNNRYLLMEHLSGLSLRKYVEQSNFLANAQLRDVRRICESLIDLVKQCHTQGIVLRDLSPNNILVTSAGCQVVDLELGYDLSSGERPFSGSTPGYVPLGEETHSRVTYAYDFYALGSLLCFVITGVHPYLSETENILPRICEMLTAGTFLRDSSLADIVTLSVYLLTHRKLPASLPSTVSVVGEAQSSCPEDMSSFSKNELLYNAVAIADYLYEKADWANTDQLWSFISSRGSLFHPTSFYGGATGIAYYLCEVAQVIDDPAYYTRADKIMTWVLSHHPLKPGETPLGLYFGYAGVPWILTILGRGLENDTYFKQAATLANQLAQIPPARLDLTHGAAGIGLMHLKIFQETGNTKSLEYAINLGQLLLDHVEYNLEGGAFWKENLPDGPRNLWGFAHGSAGIAYFMLALYDQTHDLRVKEVIDRVNTDLLQAAVLTAQDRGYSWLRDSVDKSVPWTHWCNGASGVGTYLLTAAHYFKNTKLEEAAVKAAFAIQLSTGMSTSCQCHGLAGDGEYLIQVGRLLNQPEIMQAAYHFARKLYTLRLKYDGIPGFIWEGETRNADPDYMTGYCGIYGFFLRLFDEDLSRPLSLTF